MKKALLLVLLVTGVIGLGVGSASADPICVGAGVDPAHTTVCTP